MFASLKLYIDFARSSGARLPRMVAEIDVIASLIKRLVPSLVNARLYHLLFVDHLQLRNDEQKW